MHYNEGALIWSRVLVRALWTILTGRISATYRPYKTTCSTHAMVALEVQASHTIAS